MAIWYRNKHPIRIRCTSCKALHRGCSLGHLECGVGSWPTVFDSPEGVAVREADVDKKKTQKTLQKNTTQFRKSARAQKSSGVVGSDDGEGCNNPPPASLVTPAGHSLVVHMEDLAPFETVLTGNGRTAPSIQLARVDLLGVLQREKGEVVHVINLVRKRRDLGRDLLASMDAEIAALSGAPFDYALSPDDLVDDSEADGLVLEVGENDREEEDN